MSKLTRFNGWLLFSIGLFILGMITMAWLYYIAYNIGPSVSYKSSGIYFSLLLIIIGALLINKKKSIVSTGVVKNLGDE